MFPIFLLLFIALFFALLIEPFKRGKKGFYVRIFRICVVLISVGIFGYYFVSKSLDPFIKNSLTVQIINKMPLPLDFYLIKINQTDIPENVYETRHVGTIRSEHYRLEYLDVKNSDEFWIAAFLGKKNMVYFSQHSLAHKNEDQNIEIKNYLIQSEKLSAIGMTEISALKLHNMKSAIWITLDLLLLFLNLVLIFKKPKEKSPV